MVRFSKSYFFASFSYGFPKSAEAVFLTASAGLLDIASHTIPKNTTTLVLSLQYHPNASLNSRCYYVNMHNNYSNNMVDLQEHSARNDYSLTNNLAKQAAAPMRSLLPQMISMQKRHHLWLFPL